MTTVSGTSCWTAFLSNALRSGTVKDRTKALEFLSLQTELESEEVTPLLGLIQELLLDHDPQIRYFARKTRNAFLKFVKDADGITGSPYKDEGTSPLSTKEILLRKMRLGSRYVSFEAMERLTESHDPSLADSLIEFLNTEIDAFKISYLVKRIWRIPDARVPPAIEAKLQHQDLRIVANALEGLWDLDVPHLKNQFSNLAKSNDNRVRGNAVRALHKYDPEEAEKHLEEMLESNSVALQDSAVFLLKVLLPKNLPRLAELALNSQFVGIRLKALEIPQASRQIPEGAKLTAGKISKEPLSDIQGLAISLFAGGLMTFALPASAFMALSILGLAILLILYGTQNSKFFLVKTGLSMTFISTAGMLSNPLFFIPSLMLVWFGLQETNPIMKSRGHMFACFFVFSVLLVSGINFTRYEMLAEGINNFAAYLGKSKVVLNLLRNQKQAVYQLLFVMVSIGILIMVQMDRWFPKEIATEKRNRYFLMIILGGTLATLAAQLSHGFGLATLLSTNGLTDPTHIIKLLAE